MTRELLDTPDHQISGLYALKDWLDENPMANLLPEDKLIEVSPSELKQISTLSTPNQVLATVEIPQFSFDPQYLQSHWTFFLDNIQDPGNMGTILRIADWFGLEWICLSKGCVDVYNPKVVQASMGAVLRIKHAVVDLKLIHTKLEKLPVLGADMSGENIFQAKLESRGLVIIGNEGQGISASTRQYITRQIAIPRAPKGRAESLNAGVAAGIFAALMSR